MSTGTSLALGSLGKLDSNPPFSSLELAWPRGRPWNAHIGKFCTNRSQLVDTKFDGVRSPLQVSGCFQAACFFCTPCTPCGFCIQAFPIPSLVDPHKELSSLVDFHKRFTSRCAFNGGSSFPEDVRSHACPRQTAVNYVLGCLVSLFLSFPCNLCCSQQL